MSTTFFNSKIESKEKKQKPVSFSPSTMKDKALIALLFLSFTIIRAELINPQDVINLNQHLIKTQDCDQSFFFIIDKFNGTGLYEYIDMSLEI